MTTMRRLGIVEVLTGDYAAPVDCGGNVTACNILSPKHAPLFY